jgi:long-chain fatty acid transport protein
MMKKSLLAAGAAALCLTAVQANAASFQLKEQSSSMQGHAFAGASAKADDLSTMFFNPAGMTRLENRTAAEGHVAYILPSAEFSVDPGALGPLGAPATGGEGGDAGVGALVPSFYGLMDLGLGDRWRTGLSVNTPFGLSTKYDNDCVGRFYAIETELLTVNVAPSVAYQLTDTLSIGGNVQAQYVDAKLTNATLLPAPFPLGTEGRSRLEGDDIAFGWGLGALWEARPDTRIGVNYRSRIVHKLDGEVDLTTAAGAAVATIDGEAGLTTPDILSAGIVHDLNDRWSVMGEVAWTNWSVFDDLTVISDAGAQLQSVDQSYDDTIFVAVGAEYKYSPQWTFRGGLAYDQAAVDTEHRTFRIPDTDRYWTSLGATYNMSDRVAFNMNYTHIFADDARVDEDDAPVTSGAVSGEFEAHVNIVTAGVTFKF